MGNLTSGEIAILVTQFGHMVLELVLHFDLLSFNSTCLDGHCCTLTTKANTSDTTSTVNKDT